MAERRGSLTPPFNGKSAMLRAIVRAARARGEHVYVVGDDPDTIDVAFRMKGEAPLLLIEGEMESDG